MILASAGLVAGVVHVLSGPDHLAAIAPIAVADRTRSLRTGVRWGVGHSVGVLGVGLLALLSRRALPLDNLSIYGEMAVGLALVGIGIWGARAALRIRDHGGEQDHKQAHAHAHAAVAVGTLHGLAGSSHLLGILPALALPSDAAAGAYLLCFGIGSIAAMGAFSTFIGWLAGRRRANSVAAHRTLLCVASSIAALVGGFWFFESLPVTAPLPSAALEATTGDGHRGAHMPHVIVIGANGNLMNERRAISGGS